ncbi:solute carrier family 22 member 6-A-like, partial [Arapaima gigas]
MAFADILEDLGSFGRFQFIHVTLLSIPGLFLASQNILNNFTGGVPGHHCTVPNRTSLALSHDISVSPLSDKEILQAFIPTEDGSTLSRCRRYTEAQWRLVGTNGSIATSDRNVTEADTETCRDGWTYEKTEFLSTIVTEVSGSSCYRASCSWSIQSTSVHVESALVSQRFGRRALLIWSHFQLATLGCCTALSTNYLVYCIFRFLTGMSVSGVILNAFSLS